MENQYPELPPHDICIATDVMEHLYRPLTAYEYICTSQKSGGILYGNFEDHHQEMFHVHPDMHDLREAVERDYVKIESDLYRKKKATPSELACTNKDAH